MATALNPISYVTGTLGSGKSYYGMRQVFRYLKDGKVVATNFDLVGDWWRSVAHSSGGFKAKLFKRQAEGVYAKQQQVRSSAYRYDVPDDLYGFELPGDPDKEDRGLLVLDEGALRLNNRNNRERLKRAEAMHGHQLKELEFYVNMRKLGWTCLIIAHSSKMLDSQIQDLGGAEVRLRNFARVKMPIIGVPMSKNPRFLAIHYWPEVRAITGREFYGLNITVARHYRSMERFSSSADVGEGLRLHSPSPTLGIPVETFEEWEAKLSNKRVPLWKQRELVGAATTMRMSTGEPASTDDADDEARSVARTEEEKEEERRASRAQDEEEELPPWL
jgi:hypothetical protein